MFRYIHTAKLVALYLREFSYKQENGQTVATRLYSFVLCLCLPFVSRAFRHARLIALAIAESTGSADQISRIIKKATRADVSFEDFDDSYYLSYDGTDAEAQFPYLGLSDPLVPYSVAPNLVVATVRLNGAIQSEVEAYLQLLIPFYVKTTINYVN